MTLFFPLKTHLNQNKRRRPESHHHRLQTSQGQGLCSRRVPSSQCSAWHSLNASRWSMLNQLKKYWAPQNWEEHRTPCVGRRAVHSHRRAEWGSELPVTSAFLWSRLFYLKNSYTIWFLLHIRNVCFITKIIFNVIYQKVLSCFWKVLCVYTE